MTEQPTRKRGRPRRNGPDEIWVSVPLPPWVVEHIDEQAGARGRFLARLFLERLQATTQAPGMARKIEQILYY